MPPAAARPSSIDLATGALAKRRLADEYDAAQERGEVATGRPGKSSNGEEFQATTADLGLTHKEIHEARQIRDAELTDPGIVRRTVDSLVDDGKWPTKYLNTHTK